VGRFRHVNFLFILVTSVLITAQIVLPVKWAFIPLLAAGFHLPNVPVFQLIGAITAYKLLILTGLLRARSLRLPSWSWQNPLDKLMFVWALWALVSSFAHHAEDHNPVTLRLSLIFDVVGSYIYARSYIPDVQALLRLAKSMVILLLPLVLLLSFEKLTTFNAYGLLGAPIPEAWIREGRVRAAGPFGISILAGTAGATSLPLLVPLYRLHARSAILGLVGCLIIVVASGSSGPVISLFASLFALGLWKWRGHLRQIKIAFLLCLAALALVMKAPIWFLIARIDIVGGSTSYHRAELINQAVIHLNEWWLVGTDYTRHWMPYGIDWSKSHVDITNHYIKMGVLGGLLLMGLLIATILKAFTILGHRMRFLRKSRDPSEFVLWCLGSSLFSHACTFNSVTYFDQSFIFFSLVIGAIGSLASVRQPLPEVASGKNRDFEESHILDPFVQESFQ
jgi:hypothetical protein